jgi:hypothetical protein
MHSYVITAAMPKPAIAPTTIPAIAPPESTDPLGVSLPLAEEVADAEPDVLLEARALEVVALLDAVEETMPDNSNALAGCNEALDEDGLGEPFSELFLDNVRFAHSDSRAWVH